ncbi:hypothetical protein [Falsihalocynthiibacter arcticus]|uniref:Translocase n=1 Tax=Falsihalocynthiibacter arcticus TaxID=1579316 RepID=A0A126UXW6_9RHOB|nr:hypothetical protein [Falsihalocynthiibacter arcticus]AML50908.1 hypothetical protein RC74_06100 [Falsihalocynthiibacter arcticus]
MRLKGNFVYVLASFAAAFSIGYALQSGEGNNAIFASSDFNKMNIGADVSLVDPETVQHTSAPADASLGLPFAPEATRAHLLLKSYPVNASARMRDTLASNPVKNAPTYSAYGVPCSTKLEALAGPAAMIEVKLSASCAPSEMFVLRQGELAVSGVTSTVGLAEISLPAMSKDPTISVTFAGGQSAVTTLHVSDFDDFERVALQWKGRTGLEIHALEFGADYGQAGHVWKNSPRKVAYATGALGGFMTRVGEGDGPDSMHAEVYSFPSGAIRRNGAVRLSVEAEITSFNCGRKILAKVMQPKSTTGVEVVDLGLTMPDCDAMGDFLVLNNLLRDLKIALN